MNSRLEWQSVTITSICERTPRVKSFLLRLPHRFVFRAGQHVDVRLTAQDGYQAQRSYSIASAPESEGDLELAIERLEGGEVSPFFHEIAAVGDEIDLRGPIGGHFIWSVEDESPVLLVAGGSGVVPLMSMLRHRAARRSTVPVAILVSARTWDDILFRDELIGLASRNDGLQLVVTTTRGSAMRPGDHERRLDRGMVAAVIDALPGPPRQCFVCGSNQFVEAASQALIAAAVDADLIRTERYGGIDGIATTFPQEA